MDHRHSRGIIAKSAPSIVARFNNLRHYMLGALFGRGLRRAVDRKRRELRTTPGTNINSTTTSVLTKK